MDPVQDDLCLPDDGSDVNHSRRTRLEKIGIKVVRSKWLAMFAVAFAVSWSFHEVDEIGQHRLARQQRITQCTIEGVAKAQAKLKDGERVIVSPILQACEEQVGK